MGDINKKSAREIVNTAILLNKNIFNVEISYRMKKKWIKLITNYPELSASLFSYGAREAKKSSS